MPKFNPEMTVALALQAHTIAVVFDLVNPIRAAGHDFAGGRNAELDLFEHGLHLCTGKPGMRVNGALATMRLRARQEQLAGGRSAPAHKPGHWLKCRRQHSLHNRAEANEHHEQVKQIC